MASGCRSVDMLVSDFLAKYFKLQGVDLLFTITGAGAVRLIHSFSENGISYVCPHHEQAAVMSSIARMRLSGKPALCVFTGGPGAVNSITGIADAYLDSLPLIVVAGQESTHNLKNDSRLRGLGVQGLRMPEITKTITKFSKTIMSSKDAPSIIDDAFNAAYSGRKGPVFIEIPMDVQWQNIPKKIVNKYLKPRSNFPANEIIVDKKRLIGNINSLLNLISESKRPLIWAGHGIRLGNAEELFNSVSRQLGIPVLTSWQVADIMPENDILYVGRAGTYGQRFANLALQNCDLLICMGTRLAIPQRGYKDHQFARAAKKVIVEIDKSEIEKIKFSFDIVFNEDIKNFLEIFNEICKKHKIEDYQRYADWKSKIKKWKQKFPMAKRLTQRELKSNTINSYNFISILSKHLKKNHVIVTDMGTSLTCTHAAIEIKKGQRLITSTGLGEMGYGLPAAIGCSLTRKKNSIVLIAGEGSLMMNLQELQSVKHLGIPLKIILLNNNSYLTIEHTHKALYNLPKAEATREKSGVSFPDFKKICNTFDIEYLPVDGYSGISNKIKKFLEYKGPILMNVKMEQDQELVPKSAIKVKKDGSIYSPPLEDLYPFLSKDELESEMIIPLLDEEL